MAEVLARDGMWTFDGETLRVTPSRDRHVHKLRQLLGERDVPLAAIAGITYEPGRKGGRLRLRLRDGADPFLTATQGRVPETADPYRLTVESGRTGVAEYFADEVRNSLLIEQIPDTPCDSWLLPGPAVPLTASAGDGSAVFDGERVHLNWNWATESGKRSAGSQTFSLSDLAGVDWTPSVGLENGFVRFRLKGAPETRQAPKHDPHCLVLWGLEKETRTIAMLLTAVTARCPHPFTPADASGPAALDPAASGGDDPDALLRRLRELGELHREGVLTEEEFTAAKQSLLRRL